MATVASIRTGTDYERRVAISEEGDAQQDVAADSVLNDGFTLDWNRILPPSGEALSDPVDSVERAIFDEFDTPAFRENVGALTVNGQMIAALIQRRHEENAGLIASAPFFTFEAPSLRLFTPTLAMIHWQKVLGLDEATVQRAIAAANGDDAREMAGRVTSKLIADVTALYQRTIAKGLSFEEFAKEARALMPDLTKHALATEYRTKLTSVYGANRYAQIRARSNVFPFMQYMIIRDGRTTWWICLPMGTAGPGGRGYIAATTDGIWIIWTPGNHWQCRADLSPIGYREAQRLGILAADGVTKLAQVGSNPMRPFGDPPKFATHPRTGAIRLVEPQEGFGGTGGAVEVAAVDKTPPTPVTKKDVTTGPKLKETEQAEIGKNYGFDVGAPITAALANTIMDAIEALGGGNGALADIAQLREYLRPLLPTKKAFDDAMLFLLWNGYIQMQSSPTPSLLKNPEDYILNEAYTRQGMQKTYYTAAGILRRP